MLFELIFWMRCMLLAVSMVTKTVHFCRHGQAQHNVRAEALRNKGCDYDTFLQAMRDDDEFDAALTEMGREEARVSGAALAEKLSGVQLVVASPLSRALETAQLVFPAQTCAGAPFVCIENLREISGLLANARRRSSAELALRFPDCDFSQISAEDEGWTADELEPVSSVVARGLAAMRWLAQRPEAEVAVVAHGGLLKWLFESPRIRDPAGLLAQRFSNGEVRSVRLTMDGKGDFEVSALDPGRKALNAAAASAAA